MSLKTISNNFYMLNVLMDWLRGGYMDISVTRQTMISKYILKFIYFCLF